MSELGHFESEIRQEFIDFATDELQVLEEQLHDFIENEQDGEALLIKARRVSSILKSRSGLADLPVLGVFAHRLEDYITAIINFSKHEAKDIGIFLDYMHDSIDPKKGLTNENISKIVRQLPAKRGEFDPSVVTKTNVEVMLIIPKGTTAQIVEREFQACGYRITTIHTTFTALEMVVRTRPDLIVINFTLDDLDGIDLANALKAIQVTKNIPTALLTAMDQSNTKSIQNLNKSVPIIRKGTHFGDDLATALSQLSIT